MTEPIIAVRGNDTEGYTVGVEPADPARPPQTFPDRRAAWGDAGGLRLVLGLRKVDFTELSVEAAPVADAEGRT